MVSRKPLFSLFVFTCCPCGAIKLPVFFFPGFTHFITKTYKTFHGKNFTFYEFF